MKSIEDHENAVEAKIYGTPPTKREREESAGRFAQQIKKAVANGGKLKVDKFTANGQACRNFSIKTSTLNSLAISAQQAEQYFGLTDEN